jgi:site-specific recombinase XerD
VPVHFPVSRRGPARAGLAPGRGLTLSDTRRLLEQFLNGQRKRLIYCRTWAFRKFALSLGFSRARWLEALHHVLTLPEVEAQTRMKDFKAWLVEQGMGRSTAKLCSTSVRPFFAFAHASGVIPWQFGHQKRDHTKARWARCTSEFRSLARRWLDYLMNLRYSQQTLRMYQSELLGFASTKVRPRSMTFKTAESWAQTCHSSALAFVTANHHVATAKTFCGWLVDVHELEKNPFRALPRRKLKAARPRYVSENTIVQLLGTARDVRDKALLELLYATGCRISEVSFMDLAHLSLMKRTGRCMGKGALERMVYLNRHAVRAIRAYLPERAQVLKRNGHEQEPALFVNQFGGRLIQGTMTSDVQRVARKAGLVGVTPHVIRHSFATHLLNRGAPFELLRRLLGHTHLVSTSTYAQLLGTRVRQDYRRARPRK